MHGIEPAKVSLLDNMPLPERRTDAAMRRCINSVVKEVATGLRNAGGAALPFAPGSYAHTPQVSSPVHPRAGT